MASISWNHVLLPVSALPLCSNSLHPTPYFNVSVCQVVSRWNVGWILFCWGGSAAVFPVIEHKALSAAREIIIGPGCNTGSKAQKKIFSSQFSLSSPISCFISLLLFPSFPNFFLLYLPFPPHSYAARWFHLTALSLYCSSIPSQQNDSYSGTVIMKVCGDILKFECLPEADVSFICIWTTSAISNLRAVCCSLPYLRVTFLHAVSTTIPSAHSQPVWCYLCYIFP